MIVKYSQFLYKKLKFDKQYEKLKNQEKDTRLIFKN